MSLFGKKSNFRTDNIKFVKELMENSQCGALSQIIVLCAIEKYCDQVLADKPGIIEAMKNNMICGETWVKGCEELKRKVEERYQKAGAEVAKIVAGG
jgi:hypothetical protein